MGTQRVGHPSPPSCSPSPPAETQTATYFCSSPCREPEAAASPLTAMRTSSSACCESSCAAFVACSMMLAACMWLKSTGGAL